MAKNAIVKLSGITKSFPGVRALDDVTIDILSKEILGLVGENGAGKSTLVKILIGLYQHDQGTMNVRGQEVKFSDPKTAIQNGIGMVFQEGCLIGNLTIAENFFLGHEDVFSRYGLLSPKAMRLEAEKLLDHIRVKLKTNRLVSELVPANRQMVEIARLLWLSKLYEIDNPVLILDEPTTVLLEEDIKRLFDILRGLKEEASIIFISHRLEEIFEISDRIAILKDGQFIADFVPSQTNIRQVEELMVGHSVAQDYYEVSEQIEPDEEEVLRISGLEVEGVFQPIDFAVRRKEIFSLVGAIGSGKEEISKCIAGVMKPDRGKIFMKGKELRLNAPSDAIDAGIGYIPIDRREEGLAPQMDVAYNINLLVFKDMVQGGIISPKKEKDHAEEWVKKGGIRTPSIKTLCRQLSGGNQQKTVLAKWLAADVEVLVLDHPTRGIDVGAKQEIYKQIRSLAAEGKTIILMSDRLEEDIGLCNRMLIVKDGKVTKEYPCPKDKKPAPVDVIEFIV